jgi:hypothetical protein
MSELLSILIAAIFASSMGLNHVAADTTKAEQSGEKMGSSNAKLDLKQAENTANSIYKASIVECKKKPSSEKKVCLEEAKVLNAKTIGAAKQTVTTAIASSTGQ